MKSIVIFVLFIGIFLIVHGVYEQKLKEAENNSKIEYRFIPRTLYEEQMGSTNDLTLKVGDIFSKESPWYDQNIGNLSDIPDFKKTDIKVL